MPEALHAKRLAGTLLHQERYGGLTVAPGVGITSGNCSKVCATDKIWS